MPARSAAPSFARALAAHGDRLALVTQDGQLSYRELAARVAAAVARLGEHRRLVLVAAGNAVEPLVAYLAALSAGHPVLLVPGGDSPSRESLAAAYDPDVVVQCVDGAWVYEERRAGSAHELHPDLALLLSTSGSTGSPKLVRLSHDNLQANAEAIATYLDIRDTDRAATTLPLHYCYGLSVVNSHLLRGAGLILTDLSVVDPCFWDLFRAAGGTTFAGVPYTFDLLDRVGFDRMRLPHLRYVTQAGGRLAPDRVRHYATLGERNGWQLYVMYGQTEATARMAYLPPELATTHPYAIGIPIPGGAFALEPLPDGDEPGTGELVYTGPNVMLGYAESPADLALGRTVHELRTGDIARRTGEGLFEVVGRRSRFVKIAGLRIDLHQVELLARARGREAACAGDDGHLVVAVEGADPDRLRKAVTRECGLPPGAVRVVGVERIPRLVSGKPDYSAVRRLAGRRHEPDQPEAATPAGLRDLFARLLDRPEATEDDTFVGLGGDSLSYVEMSVRLEQVLGHLPGSWHTTPIRDLAAARRRRGPGRAVETSVVLRALAILLIVGTHAKAFTILGSAHVLVAVAGFNYARFQLTAAGGWERLRHQVRSVARIAVPSMVWIAGAYLLTDDYSLANVVLLNAVLGPPTWTTQWHFWFVEILVYILLALAALTAVPWVARAERRHPYGFVMVLLAFGLATRFGAVDVGIGSLQLHPKPVFWLFALGWAAARARGVWQRLAVTAAIAVAVPGFFGDPRREAVIAGGLALLVWASSIRCPAAASRVASVLAASSLYVYVTHWQVYPTLRDVHPVAAVAGSLGVGIGYWMLATRALPRLVTGLRARLRRRREAVQHHVGRRDASTAAAATAVQGR